MERKRWLEVVVMEHDTSEWRFSVRVRDEQGWMVYGEFKSRKKANQCAQLCREMVQV